MGKKFAFLWFLVIALWVPVARANTPFQSITIGKFTYVGTAAEPNGDGAFSAVSSYELHRNQSVSHTPDVDINFGVGDRIQLTYENAWLRVQDPSSATKFGLGQSNLGVKWRFYDAGESKLAISTFPQLFLNNPNDAVRRGITPASQSFLLPFEVKSWPRTKPMSQVFGPW